MKETSYNETIKTISNEYGSRMEDIFCEIAVDSRLDQDEKVAVLTNITMGTLSYVLQQDAESIKTLIYEVDRINKEKSFSKEIQ